MSRGLLCVLAVAAFAAGCSKKTDDATPVATPSITLPRSGAIESPVDVTYKFVVAPNAPALTRDYRVFVHFNDPSGQQLWTDDHLPPTATSQWKPGSTIEYTRTMFVPKVPYTGDTTIDLGLYIPGTDDHPALAGTAAGQRAYRVGTFQVRPQESTAAVFFRNGWHDVEVVPEAPGVEWHWSKGESSLQFRHPQRDVTLMLDLDQPQADLPQPQQVELRSGAATLDTFSISPGERIVRRVAIPAAALGTGDNAEVTLKVSPTFSPAYLPGAKSKDVRTLGVRVFHAYIPPPEQPK